MPEKTLKHRELPDADGLVEINGVELLTPARTRGARRLVAGASNKEAGRALGISPRTIEEHRARIMEKLGAKNAADLVRIGWGRARGIEQAANTSFRESPAEARIQRLALDARSSVGI